MVFRKCALSFIYITSFNPPNRPLRWDLGWHPYFKVARSWWVVELDSDCFLSMAFTHLSLDPNKNPAAPVLQVRDLRHTVRKRTPKPGSPTPRTWCCLYRVTLTTVSGYHRQPRLHPPALLWVSMKMAVVKYSLPLVLTRSQLSWGKPAGQWGSFGLVSWGTRRLPADERLAGKPQAEQTFN